MKKSIMIIDDSEDTRELFTAALEAEGFKVISAKSGEEALDILEGTHDISLMLLDLSMPGMNGVQFLEEMQRRKLGGDIPVMVVSASDNIRAVQGPNIIDSLKKPFFYPELIFKIREQHGVHPNGH